ncbi:MAG: endonuclease, partial [Dehalococcoidia bacterium]|nr:endonuclease [Dehalococcoidia bacterium]
MGSLQEDPSEKASTLDLIYQELFARYGPQHWWPADEPFEVMVGAVLTQASAWTNVEKAIGNLKLAGVLSPHSLREIQPQELARLVYSSGYYNAKASKLKALVQYLGDKYQDSLPEMVSQATAGLREELLAVHGVGEETADSILLYAAE